MGRNNRNNIKKNKVISASATVSINNDNENTNVIDPISLGVDTTSEEDKETAENIDIDTDETPIDHTDDVPPVITPPVVKKAPVAKKAPAEKKAVDKVLSPKLADIILVYLKHPHGIKFPLAGGRDVTLKGNAEELRGLKSGTLPTSGYGMTEVPSADWEEVLAKYKSMKIFKSSMVTWANDKSSGKSKTDEHDELKSGFEPMAVGANATVGALSRITPTTVTQA